MGIKGLWRALQEYVDDAHLSQFRGQRVAIDMYVWLHRCIHRAVRIESEAVLTYLDAKYRDGGPQPVNGSSMASTVPLFSMKQEKGAEGKIGYRTASDTSATPSDDPPLPSIDEVLVIEDAFISAVLEKVTALQRFGVIPVCVFDGAEMPMKDGTETERLQRRTEAFRSAMARLEQLYCLTRQGCGDEGRSLASGETRRSAAARLPRHHRLFEEATQLLEQAVDISAELAHTIVQVLREERQVECIVAPYEADAQLAYLCREGYVAAAASEDSDLIAYYCPCVIAKLDTASGRCVVVQPPLCAPAFFRSFVAGAGPGPGTSGGPVATVAGHNRGGGAGAHARLRAAAQRSLPSSPTLEEVESFRASPSASSAPSSPSSTPVAAGNFTYESFLLGCIMSGCDYVANLRSIGVKKAFKLVANASSLRQVFTTLEREYGFPAEDLQRYRQQLLESFYCFAHHLVYCPVRQEMVTFHLLPPTSPGGAASLKTQLVGRLWDQQLAQEVCVQCLKDPSTHRLYRGLFQSCVSRYIQRTRRGQTSLTAYSGFEDRSSNKIVLDPPRTSNGHLVTVKREPTGATQPCKGSLHGASTNDEVSDFGSPLQKQCEVYGFLGSRRGEENRGETPAKMTVVRSRYFLRAGRTAVCERWSSSEEEEEQTSEDSPTQGTEWVANDRKRARSAEALLSLSPHSELHRYAQSGVADVVSPVCGVPSTTSRSTGKAAGQSAESTPESAAGAEEQTQETQDSETPTLMETPTAQVVEEVAVVAYADERVRREPAISENASPSPPQDAPEPPQQLCGCPFGYWQCNRGHSVFESCFAGKAWSRTEKPTPSWTPTRSSHAPQDLNHISSACTAAAATAVSPCEEVSVHQEDSLASFSVPFPLMHRYVQRPFRPPRSTAADGSSSSCLSSPSIASSVENTTTSELPSSRKKDGQEGPAKRSLPTVPTRKGGVPSSPKESIFEAMTLPKK